MTPARATLALSTALCLLLATGCSGEEPAPAVVQAPVAPPSPTETPTNSPTSPAATPTARPLPEPTELTPSGASAFVRYYVHALNLAQAGGRTDELKALSARSCRTCTNFVEGIDDIYTVGSLRGGGQTEVVFAATPGLEPGAREAQVTLILSYPATEHLDAEGEVVRSEPGAQDLESLVTLRRDDNKWRVAQIEVLEQQS